MTFSTLASPGVSLQGGGGSGGGGGGTPGGSNTQIQYNSSGTFAGASGLTTNGTELTIASGTKTADAPVLNMSQTWNNGAVTFTGLKFNATDTASNAASLLLDIGTGGGTYVSRFSVQKDGGIVVAGNFIFGASTATMGRTSGQAIGFGVSGLPRAQVNGADGEFRSISTGSYSFSSHPGNVVAAAADTIITRRAAANLRFGAADAAAPVPQILSVQSVVAGTSNTAGANLTITGSQSTGSGAGGSIIFQTAAANSGGGATVQNTLANAMVIDSVKTVRLGTGYTVATLPAAGTAGRRTYVTDATLPTFLGTLTGGGAVVCPVFDNGTAWVSA